MLPYLKIPPPSMPTSFSPTQFVIETLIGSRRFGAKVITHVKPQLSQEGKEVNQTHEIDLKGRSPFPNDKASNASSYKCCRRTAILMPFRRKLGPAAKNAVRKQQNYPSLLQNVFFFSEKRPRRNDRVAWNCWTN